MNIGWLIQSIFLTRLTWLRRAGGGEGGEEGGPGGEVTIISYHGSGRATHVGDGGAVRRSVVNLYPSHVCLRKQMTVQGRMLNGRGGAGAEEGVKVRRGERRGAGAVGRKVG